MGMGERVVAMVDGCTEVGHDGTKLATSTRIGDSGVGWMDGFGRGGGGITRTGHDGTKQSTLTRNGRR